MIYQEKRRKKQRKNNEKEQSEDLSDRHGISVGMSQSSSSQGLSKMPQRMEAEKYFGYKNFHCTFS